MIAERIYNYFERNPRLHVLFVFEEMSMISEELANIAWPDDYVYHVFDGAWFNTKYNIENTWKDKKVVLLFRFMEYAYPQTEEDQRNFPLMDMLRANMEYKEDDYASFLQQYNLPDKYAAFVKRHIGEIRSPKIQDILNGYLNSESFSEDLVIRAIISNYLGEKRLLDWDVIIVKMIILGKESEAKKRLDFFNKVDKNPDVKKHIDMKLKRIFWATYNPNKVKKMEDIAASLKYNAITQLLSAEAADNYKAYKVTDGASIASINKVYERGTEDRQLSAKFNEAMEDLAGVIKESEIIKVYGTRAPYFHYTEKLCWPILDQLLSETLMESPEQTIEQVRQIMLKLPMGSDIMTAAQFLNNLALFHDKMRGIGSLKFNKPIDYVNRYIEDYHTLDILYRRTLEAYHALLTRQIPIAQTIEAQKHQLDLDYAKFANVLNLEWINCVADCGGTFENVMLPRQQNFYNDEYATGGGATKLAVIISDALRYEVAAELMESLSKRKHIARLSADISILPTETSFSKRVLFPHSTLSFDGKAVLNNGIDLNTVAKRASFLENIRNGATCVKYMDIMNDTQENNRELFKRPLVYILHDTIDDAGHSQNPFDVIHACRRSIEQLTSLISTLHATWNVTNVILTSDHGFLYNDIRFEDKDKEKITEPTIDGQAKTRYYLTYSDKSVTGVQKFPLEVVSGISSTKPIFVAVPKGTNRFAAAGGYSFAHGGASLQEMIVPVIHSVAKRLEKTEKVGVTIMNTDLMVVSSRLKFRLMQREAVNMNLQERTIICCLYDGDKPVSAEKTVVLNSTDSLDPQNRMYEIVLLLNQPTSASMLQLRIFDADDKNKLNPIVIENVKNNTLIDQDF